MREQLKLQESRRQSEHEGLEQQLNRVESHLVTLLDRYEGQAKDRADYLSQYLGEKLDMLYEQAGVPVRDIPTIDELLAQAKSEPALRKLVESALAELEFSDPQIEFN